MSGFFLIPGDSAPLRKEGEEERGERRGGRESSVRQWSGGKTGLKRGEEVSLRWNCQQRSDV